jgi:hypothetical protein
MNQNRFPLIINSESGRIEELAAGDNLDLTGSNIANVINVNVSGNIAAVGIKTDNYMYANGQPFAGGSGNVEYANTAGVAYSVDAANVVGTVASSTQADTANVANSVAGANVTGTVASATQADTANVANSVAAANIVGTVANATFANSSNIANIASYAVEAGSANVVSLASQPNITSVGTLTGLSVSGNATITGNLTVSGTTQYTNVTNLQIQDPVIQQGGGANGNPLTTNDGKDRGSLLHYYTTEPVNAFMGWDTSNAEFAFGSNVSISNDVITFTQLGNVRAGNFIGNGSQLTGITASTVNGANVVGTVATSNVSLNANVTAHTVLSPTVNFLGAYGNTGNLPVQGIGAVTYNTVSGLQAPIVTSNNFVGNGSQLTNLNAANIVGTINASTALQANVANVANTVAGANVTGTVANATFATTAGVSNTANVQTLGLDTITLVGGASTSGNLQLRSAPIIANVGQVTITSINGITSPFFNGDGVNLSNITGANVTGTVASATVASTANVALSVDAANIVGEVSNATFATTAGTANIANIAYSVDAANISGEVANAVFATTAGTADIANVAYSVDAANVVGEVANAAYAITASNAESVDVNNITGIGNIATVNLSGLAGDYLNGEGNWVNIEVPNLNGVWKVATATVDYTTGTAGIVELPVAGLVDRVTVIVDEAWDSTPTISVGYYDSESQYFPVYVETTDVNLTVAGRYDIPVSAIPDGENTISIVATVDPQGATQGSARIVLTYAQFS